MIDSLQSLLNENTSLKRHNQKMYKLLFIRVAVIVRLQIVKKTLIQKFL